MFPDKNHPFVDWSAEPVYLLGGGASLRGKDLGCLTGRRVVAINDAVREWPEAMAFFTVDGTFFHSRPEPLEGYRGWKFIALPPHRFRHFELDQQPRVIRLERQIAPGISRTPGLVHVGNSGFGALNLVVQLGARKIVLLGYDLNPTKDTHAFREPNDRYDRKTCERHVCQFDSAVPQLDALGVEVLNANPHSAITCFRTLDWEQLPLP